MSGMVGTSAIVVVTVAAAWLLTAAARSFAEARGILDVPGPRSSHDEPTPRGGGIAIVLPVLVALGLAWRGGLPLPVAAAGAVALLVTAFTGLIDDFRPLPVLPRLTAHLAAAATVAWMALQLDAALLPGSELPLPITAICWAFWTVSCINVINFMDGIDGIIGLQAVLYGVFAAIALRGDPTLSLIAVVLAASAAGFLLLNWYPAKVFLGDVGSGSIGLLFVLLGVLIVSRHEWSVLRAFLPLATLFADEILTMQRRLRAGERLWRPHRRHVYQLMVRNGWRDDHVALLYAFLALPACAWSLLAPRSAGIFMSGFIVLVLLNLIAMQVLFLRNRQALEV
jgi:Fuc2NAc and GlcNAc transferase